MNRCDAVQSCVYDPTCEHFIGCTEAPAEVDAAVVAWQIELGVPDRDDRSMIRCRVCGAELVVGPSWGWVAFTVAELLTLVDAHVPVCPGAAG